MSPKPQAPVADAPAPSFVFVENAAMGPRTLLWRSEGGGPSAAESKILGPGMNWVDTSILERCVAKGEEFGEAFGGKVRITDPRSLRVDQAVELATITTSRQAATRWLEIETRPPVRKALEERLAVRGPRKMRGSLD